MPETEIFTLLMSIYSDCGLLNSDIRWFSGNVRNCGNLYDRVSHRLQAVVMCYVGTFYECWNIPEYRPILLKAGDGKSHEFRLYRQNNGGSQALLRSFPAEEQIKLIDFASHHLVLQQPIFISPFDDDAETSKRLYVRGVYG